MSRIRITGETSMPPRLGSIERIGRSSGSVMPVQEVADHVHHLIAGVDHVEGDQPGQNGGGDQQPDIDLQDQQNDIEDRAHEYPPVRGGRKLAGRMGLNKPTGGRRGLRRILDRPKPWP